MNWVARKDDLKHSRPSLSMIFHAAQRRNILPLAILTVLVFVVISILSPTFLSGASFQAMGFNFPQFGLLATAVMLSMLTGGIDLSIVGAANLSGVIAALIILHALPSGDSSGPTVVLVVILGFLSTLVIGGLCGIFNGFLISKLHIPEILATLGTMQLFTGIAMILTKGQTLQGFPNQVMVLGNATLLGIPISVFVFLICIVLVGVILNKTVFGFEIYMLGTNAKAAQYTGINNTKLIIKTYTLGGVLSGIAGALMISSTSSADASYGSSFLLQTIVVAVLGGINPSGGFGTVGGLVLALICQQFLSSGFQILQIGGSSSSYVTQMTWGLILVVVMILNYVSATKMKRER